MTCPMLTWTICTHCIFSYNAAHVDHLHHRFFTRYVAVIASSRHVLFRPSLFMIRSISSPSRFRSFFLFPFLYSFLPQPCPSSHRSSPAPSLLIPPRPFVFLSTLPPPLPSLIFILYFPFPFYSLLSFRVAR